MERIDAFMETIGREMAVRLATSLDGRVSTRPISPVCCPEGILMFTGSNSLKYGQLRGNPHCGIAAGFFDAEADAEFLGATMLDRNAALREIYEKKFPGAFAEGDAFGGWDKEFILLKPTLLRGWEFPGGVPTPDGVPTVYFEMKL